MSHRLDRLLREAREDLGRREAEQVDWTAVDRGLFERIARAPRAETRAPRWSIALGLAMAAGVLATVGVFRGHASPAPVTAQTASPPARVQPGDLVVVDPASAVVDGRPAVAGQHLAIGDVIEGRGGSMTLQRIGKLTLSVETDARVRIKELGEGLVVELEAGAVEARVVPVPSGVAFAVDVARARVAVHGTHLRVQRTDPREVVDLSEGVVSVEDLSGRADRALLTAPAHAEFVSEDAVGTLVVTREASAMRPPVDLRSAGLSAPSVVPPRSDRVAASVETTHPGLSTREEPLPVPSGSAPTATAPTDPATVLAAAVHGCLANRPRAENVTVVVHSTLHVEAAGDGTVRAAHFDPPVAADVNECAAPAIYQVRLAPGSVLSVPIDESY